MKLMFCRNKPVGLTIGSPGHIGTYAMDTTDDFHVYRITISLDGSGQRKAKLYIDNYPSPVISIVAWVRSVNPGEPRLAWGNQSSSSAEAYELDYFWFTDEGAFAAEGWCGTGSSLYPIGDLNKDCVTNIHDLEIFCQDWLKSLPGDCEQIWESGQGLQPDFDKNCSVDLKDYATFAANWKDEYPVMFGPHGITITQDRYPQNPVFTCFIDETACPVFHPRLIKIGSLFHMYYAVEYPDGKTRVNLATSSDLIDWTDYPGNPVDKQSLFG